MSGLPDTWVMSTSARNFRFDEDNMWVALSDGRTLGVPLAWFPRLLQATSEQRLRYEISGSGAGLHWPELDEDISVAGLLAGEAGQRLRRAPLGGVAGGGHGGPDALQARRRGC